MNISRFFIFLLVLFVVALLVYTVSAPNTSQVELNGIVTGTDAIVSPLAQGRLAHLLVDEGSEVKAGQLLAEIDPLELESVRESAEANIRAVEARVQQSSTARTMSDEQTRAALQQAEANLRVQRAQLEQVRATQKLSEVTHQRAQELFASGVVSAQERDAAERDWLAAQANVKSSDEMVQAAQAQLAVAQANRKQVDVQGSDVAATRAQLAQAVAQKNQAVTQLGYTRIYAPISGIVSVRVARQGEVVQAGGPIVTILDIDHLWVQAGVEESMIDSIAFGEKLTVRLPSGNTVQGTVFFKGVESEFATQRDVSRTKRDIKTFAIKVGVPNEGRRLFAGMTAFVLLPAKPISRRWFQFWRG